MWKYFLMKKFYDAISALSWSFLDSFFFEKRTKKGQKSACKKSKLFMKRAMNSNKTSICHWWRYMGTETQKTFKKKGFKQKSKKNKKQ